MDCSASTLTTAELPDNAGECFKWTIYKRSSLCFHYSFGRPSIIRSATFCPNDCDMECFLCLKDDGGENSCEKRDDPSDLFLSLFVERKRQKVYGTFEFIINSSPDSTMKYRNRPCGGHLAAIFSEKVFFSQSDYMGSFGVITVKWHLDRLYPETDELYTYLGENMYDLLESGKFSDVDIKTQDGSLIPVHQNILSVRAPYLFSMIKEGSVDHEGSNRKVIEIPDLTRETVESMLTYIYSGLPRVLCDYPALLVAAQRYHLKELQDFCASVTILTT